MELRPASQEDAAAIAGTVVAVARHAFSDLLPHEVEALDVEEETAEWSRRLDGTGSVAVVGQQGELLVAVAAWSPVAAPEDPEGSGATLTHLLVHPAAQNAGVGGVLLERAEALLRADGVERVRLPLHREAWWAARFLAARGWSTDDEIVEDAPSSIWWERAL